MIGPAQIFLRAQIEDMARIRQRGFKFNRFLQGFVAAGLLQIFAHLIIHVALEGDQLGVAGAKAMNPNARARGDGDFWTEVVELPSKTSRAMPKPERK